MLAVFIILCFIIFVTRMEVHFAVVKRSQEQLESERDKALTAIKESRQDLAELKQEYEQKMAIEREKHKQELDEIAKERKENEQKMVEERKEIERRLTEEKTKLFQQLEVMLQQQTRTNALLSKHFPDDSGDGK